MRQNIIFSIMMVLTVALSVVSCSNETEESSVEARVLELKHKIYATAEEYGVRNYTINEENLRAHLDMTDAEIDSEFKSIVDMVGTYVGKKGADGKCQLQKSFTKTTRYGGVYPEQITGTKSGDCSCGEWDISITINYVFDGTEHPYAYCSDLLCYRREGWMYNMYYAHVTQESSFVASENEFDYDARIVIEDPLITCFMHIYATYNYNLFGDGLRCRIELDDM